MTKRNYYDISPVLSGDTVVFPGDTAFQRRIQMDFAKGQHLLLSDITTTLHIGAHADAPNHYHPQGVGIAERDLTRYLGRAQVVTVSNCANRRIQIEDVSTPIKAPRVLLRTQTFPDPGTWTDAFASLSPELIRELRSQGVVLVGLDTPSVDPATSKDLPAHKAIFEADMAILEGLVLTDVPDGEYTLLALPLRIKDADASPVRAILVRDSTLFTR